MRYLAAALLLLIFGIQVHAVPKKIQVKYNRTIETIMILRALSDEDYFLGRIPQDAKKRPLLYEARQYFKAYKTHPAVAETQKMLEATQDIGGTLFQGVLYAEELPGCLITTQAELVYWKKNKPQLEAYMKLLQKFYNDADVSGFFTKYQRYYSGAVAEAQSYMKDSSIEVMERYFGKANNSYTLLILPLCPYGWGFSANTHAKVGEDQYAIVSPVGNSDWKERISDYKAFGFAGPEAPAHYRELVTHEFTHSFITNVLDRPDIKKQINRYDSLYTPSLDSAMQDQGYGDWWGFVNEHLVRAAEIRVARIMDAGNADAMVKQNVNEYKFILLPEAEVLMKQYETNRKVYKTIDAFLPLLIKQMGKFSKRDVNNRLMQASGD